MGNADHVFKSSTCLAASFCSHGRLPIGLTNYQGECPAIDCAIEATRGARLKLNLRTTPIKFIRAKVLADGRRHGPELPSLTMRQLGTKGQSESCLALTIHVLQLRSIRILMAAPDLRSSLSVATSTRTKSPFTLPRNVEKSVVSFAIGEGFEDSMSKNSPY